MIDFSPEELHSDVSSVSCAGSLPRSLLDHTWHDFSCLVCPHEFSRLLPNNVTIIDSYIIIDAGQIRVYCPECFSNVKKDKC